ncbi:5'/3'-nucleotidase SurE [Halobaculum sp. MBLA0143]|uniref:5'/3'-nucleotidase SurE n=1 Tax=Halobaculum sp. MBLA0143 TaxID=3079933 RepID=UPI003526A358
MPTQVLLTNDDGIDSRGLAAVHEQLQRVADVTVVAPADNQSGVGRSRSRTVDVDNHERGYAVHGTPVDCVAYAVAGLETEFDLVVSGCNLGPNCGAYGLGYSGTVGAVVEGAFLGLPGIAASGYHREEFFPPRDTPYDVPATVTRRLVERALSGDALDRVGYLNVNAPVEREGHYRVTRPLTDYEVSVGADEEEEGDDVRFHTRGWPTVSTEERFPRLADADGDYPPHSDRAAVVAGDVSVSPLREPQEPVHDPAVDELVVSCNETAE